jgi:low temperature requirement protein LtrA
MTGRDPAQAHRTATPLELLFDLTFVVAFSQAGNQMAHLLAEGHVGSALAGFGFATFAICWAWINYSWLASAYDTDDIFFRVATLVVMVGVLVLALGLPAAFHSIDEGDHLDNRVVVAGYVVMRVANLALWLRAAAHDPVRRRTCLTYAATIGVAQAGWLVVLFVDPPLSVLWIPYLALVAVEMAGPVLAERGEGTPWHPHHIAERYGLLVIITLGEVILGTITAISAVVETRGWSAEAVLLAVAGTALAFGLWWVYFMMPSAEVLSRHRERAFPWGYLHILIFGSLAATGAGLHVAAYVIEHEAHIGPVSAVLTTAVPVLVFTAALFVVYSLLMAAFDPFHTWLFVGAIAALVVAVVVCQAGASLGVSLLVVAAAPLIVIIGYETKGHRHQAAALAET